MRDEKEKQVETLYAVIRKIDAIGREFIDLDSFERTPGRAVAKSNRAAKRMGDEWICDNPIQRTTVVFVKEL